MTLHRECGAVVSEGSFDDKSRWTPLVKATDLVAVQSELTPPKKYLGQADLLTATANDVRFLELGGWKDKDADHEAGVSASTTNLYADRADIAAKYRGTLQPSRFWYHAEVYEKARGERQPEFGGLRSPGHAGPGHPFGDK